MKLRLVFCLLIFSIYSSHLSSQDILMGIKEVDPGSAPHKLTLFYTFQADFVAPARHIWNSQLFMLRYSSTLPVPATFISGTVNENCFGWAASSVGEFNGDHYIIYTDSDGATCPFNNNQIIDMLTISFDNSTTAFSTASFEIVPPGDPSIIHFGFGDPAINNAASGINEFNGFNPGSVSGLVLPVKLLAFSAKPSGDDVVLNWKTVSEINFSHYDIQRSVDQRNWEYLGRITAKGQVSTVIDYQWIDGNAFAKSNQFYYRLKMVDVDNSVDYSPIRYIQSQGITEKFKLYPNPTSDVLIVDIQDWTGEPVKVMLINFQGKRFFEQSITTSSEIDVRALPAGIYLVQLQAKNGELLMTERVVIQ